ncbi:MAG: hypothetical protein ACE5JP_15915 [Candidatus Bipolaricaulia bacterium]
MHTIGHLIERYGLSARAIRRRLNALRPEIDAHVRRGPRNAILLSDNGLSILDRLIDLERDAGMGSTAAAKQVKTEVQMDGETIAKVRPDTADAVTAANRLIEHLEARIESLEHQLEERNREIERFHGLLHRQLPGQVDPWWRRWFGRRD